MLHGSDNNATCLTCNASTEIRRAAQASRVGAMIAVQHNSLRQLHTHKILDRAQTFSKIENSYLPSPNATLMEIATKWRVQK